PRELPPTILSRVQRFDFRPISHETLTATLERILTDEKIAYERDALPAVVRASEGSLRDALSLLDTAIAYGNGTLEAATTAKRLTRASSSRSPRSARRAAPSRRSSTRCSVASTKRSHAWAPRHPPRRRQRKRACSSPCRRRRAQARRHHRARTSARRGCGPR